MLSSGSTSYTVNAYIDDQTMTSLTDFKTGSSTSTVVFNIPSAPWTTTIGTINPKDTQRHHFWAKITNSGSFPAGVPCITGNGWPYIWTGSVIGYTYDLYTSVSSVGATAADTAVVANTSSVYSIGSTGATKCNIGGVPIKDDGVAGYYIGKYSIPCGHVHTVTGGTLGTVSAPTMATAFATLSPALGSDEQYMVIGWFSPFRVTGMTATGDAGTVTGDMSVASYFAYGGQLRLLRLQHQER